MVKTKSLPWFCFHTDWRVNPKVRTMSESMQLHYIEIMCLKREGFYPCTIEELAYHLRVKEDYAESIIELLTDRRLLEDDGEIHDWDKRQIKDYTSTDRVRKHREKEKERSSNVTMKQDGTPYITEQDITKTEQKKKRGAGKPAVVSFLKESQEVLDHLNQKIGKGFTTTRHIEACFKRENCTVAQCKKVIDFKTAEWKGTNMEKNMNPRTPWRDIHFKDYLDEAGATAAAPIDKRRRDSNGRVMQQWEIDMEDSMEG